MDHLNNQEGAASAQKPPPYSEKAPNNQQPPAADGSANPTMPTQYQPYYDAPQGAVVSQGPVIQPPLHITVVPVQPTPASDYLLYSIFTMLCCCLPLGIAALIYSIRTREANHLGNGTMARQHSRMARNLALAALGVGTVIIILSIVLGLTSDYD